MDTEERLATLERKAAEYDRIIAFLTIWARMTTRGRAILKQMGLS